MKVTSFAPCRELAPVVRSIEIVTSCAEVERTLLPDPGLVLGLRYAGAAALVEGGAARPLPGRSITGLRTTARRMRTSAGGGIVVVKFHTLGAGALVDGPLHRLFGELRPLDEVVDPGALDEATARLGRARSDEERVAVVEGFLRARCVRRPVDRLVARVVEAIEEAPGSIRIGPLAQRLGVSQDALEKRFRRVVGASPKAFASLVHVRDAVRAFPQQASLTGLAMAAGFYDQSHFNRRFRAVAGAPPGQVLGSPEVC